MQEHENNDNGFVYVTRALAFGYFLQIDIDPCIAARCPRLLLDFFLFNRNVREEELHGSFVLTGRDEKPPSSSPFG